MRSMSQRRSNSANVIKASGPAKEFRGTTSSFGAALRSKISNSQNRTDTSSQQLTVTKSNVTPRPLETVTSTTARRQSIGGMAGGYTRSSSMRIGGGVGRDDSSSRGIHDTAEHERRRAVSQLRPQVERAHTIPTGGKIGVPLAEKDDVHDDSGSIASSDDVSPTEGAHTPSHSVEQRQMTAKEMEAAIAAKESIQKLLNANVEPTGLRESIVYAPHVPSVNQTPTRHRHDRGKTGSVSKHPHSSPSSDPDVETVTQTLGRIGRPSEHAKSVIQFCKAHVPLFNYFQLEEDRTQSTSVKYHWSPRNDLLARCLQHFEVMGYRNNVFSKVFESHTKVTSAAIQRGGATTELLTSCATILESLSPDAPVPSLFSSKVELTATLSHPTRPETTSESACPSRGFDVSPCLPSSEGHRWMSEQEYVAASVLFSITRTKLPDQDNTEARNNSAGPQKGAAFTLASRSSGSDPGSYLLHEIGLDGRAEEALSVAFDLLNDRSRRDQLTASQKADLLSIILSSHPIVYVALRFISVDATGMQLARSDSAVAFADAWFRQATAIFVAPSPNHNHVLRAPRGVAGGGLVSPFELIPCNNVHQRQLNLFSVHCESQIGKWISTGSGLPALAAPNDLPVVITSDVECGSVAPSIDRYDPLPTREAPKPTPTYLFRGCGDTAEADCKRVWFNFAAKRVPYGSVAQFRAMNMAPHGRLYRGGMRPVCRFGGALFAVTGRNKHTAKWHLVADCTYIPVRNEEEAEIAFSVQLPSYNYHEDNDPIHTFRCQNCSLSGTCVQCRIKAWLLVGISYVGSDSTWQHIPPALSSTLHISFCEPYSYGSLLSHIALWHSLVKRSASSIRFEERVLCQSFDGRKLHLLIVSSMSDRSSRQDVMAGLQGGSNRTTSGGRLRSTFGVGPFMQGLAGWQQMIESQGFYMSAPPASVISFAAGKKVVLLSGRVHPSEVTGSFALHGLVQFLLSSDARAAQLRENFIFFIVPMLNPDGVARGHNRLDQFGNNLNRCYTNPSPETQPTVLALKNVFDFLQQHYRDRFIMYMDFHSHASQMLGFAFGNCLAAPLQPWNMLFPRLIEAHSGGLFSTAGSKFAKTHMASKDGTSRVIFGASLLHSYTMELTHFGHLNWAPGVGVMDSPSPPTQSPHEDWETYTASSMLLEDNAISTDIKPFFVVLRQSAEVGRACVTALLDYCAIGVPEVGSQSALGKPSEALVKAGGMERLLRESRRVATKSIQQQQPKPKTISNTGANKPQWN